MAVEHVCVCDPGEPPAVVASARQSSPNRGEGHDMALGLGVGMLEVRVEAG